jgi:hypothetical protein
MLEPFEPLRETLLLAGVAPVHVRRYMRELSEHLSDLVGEELKAGRSLPEARAAARPRLGDDKALADAVLAQPSLRSWTGRAPWATLVALPIMLLALAWVLPCMGLVFLVRRWANVNGAALPPGWLNSAGGALLDFIQVAGPLLIGSGIALLGARQRSRMIWPSLGCVVVGFFGAGVHWVVHWPYLDALGHKSFGISLGFQWSQSLAMGSLSLAVAAAVYGMASRRMLAVT